MRISDWSSDVCSSDLPVFKNSGQDAVVDFSTANYVKEVARARTFGFMRELDVVGSNNLSLGASRDNGGALSDCRGVHHAGLRHEHGVFSPKSIAAVGQWCCRGESVNGRVRATRKAERG